jgi:hypothetical protein
MLKPSHGRKIVKHIKSFPLRLILIMSALLLVLVVIAPNVHITYANPADAAPRTTGYEISWYTIDGGGAMNLQGGSYTLSGTIGQPDAGTQSGGSYTLNGGFWVDLFGYRLYLPLIMR